MSISDKPFYCGCVFNDPLRDSGNKVGQCKHLSFDGCIPPHLHNVFNGSDENGINPKRFHASKMTKLERKYPPVSLVDTAYFQNGNVTSVHGSGNLFEDEEILKVHEITASERIGGKDESPIYAHKTENGKYAIQQQATRGCTSGATAMLIKDHGKNVDIFSLVRRNLGGESDKLRDLTTAGLEPIKTSISRDLDQLKELLKKDGSAIISIDGELGNHVIIADAIEKDSARIRDPYHGWEITVTLGSLEKRFSGGSVIQVRSP